MSDKSDDALSSAAMPSPATETLRSIADELGNALGLLGADGRLQAAMNCFWEGDHEIALSELREWNELQRDMIASVIEGYARSRFWGPSKRYASSDRGCSRRVDQMLRTIRQQQGP